MMWPQMGNHMYTAKLNGQHETDEFIHFVQEQI